MIQEEAEASSPALREAVRDTDRCDNKLGVETAALDLSDK